MGDEELKQSLVNTVALLAAQQKQFGELQALMARQLINPSAEINSGISGSISTSHLNVFKFAAFDDTIESFTDFVDRLESYFRLQNVKASDQAGCLVTALPPKLFKLLKNLLYPESYVDKSYTDIKKVLEEHLNPVPLVIPSRHALFTRRQLESETITEYLTALQQLAVNCKYTAEVLAIVLRDVFVSGLRSKTILDRLFQEDDPSLSVVVKIAQSIERAEGATHEVLSSTTPVVSTPTEITSLNLVKTASERQGKRFPVYSKSSKQNLQQSKVRASTPSHETTSEGATTCFSCGETGHRRPQCTKTNLHCEFCGREGHVEQVCFRKKQQPVPSVKRIEESNLELDDYPYDEFALYQLSDFSHQDEKIFVCVWIEDCPAIFELDSGSKRTLINKTLFDRLCLKVPVQPTRMKLCDYNGQPVEITGEATVRVSDRKITKANQTLLIVHNRPSVIGRDWMSALKWLTKSSLSFDRVVMQTEEAAVHKVNVECHPPRLQSLIQANTEIFTAATGKAVNRVIALELQPDAKPVFRKARVVPLALRQAVESEIDKLVAEGIWQPVTTSEWATPLVPVVKPKGIRLCGDYSCTVNPQSRVAQHPFPGFDEVFASLAKGKRFSKLDVRSAFLHLPVNEETAKILTLNTHKGLFRPTRLMYGVNSAPALWQKYVDSLFANIECCVVHDDLIVTGATEDEHINRLEQIFQVCR